MTRLYRFTTIGLIWILATFIHLFGAVLFAPGTELYGLADPAVGTYIDAEWQDTMYIIFVQYIPLIFVGGSAVWGFAKEWEDAVTGGYR